jgi:hypothetical protein
MSRRPAALVLGALAVTVLVAVASCGMPEDRAFEPVAGDDIPYGLLETTTSTSTTTTSTTSTTILRPTTTLAPTTTTTDPVEQVSVYFVLGSRLTPVARMLPKPVTPTEAMIELQLGPTREDRPIGVRSSVQPDMIGEVQVQGGTAFVNLAGTFLNLSQPEQILAFGQIVGTLTDLRGIGRVAFTIDGRPVDAQRGDGSLAPESVSRDDYLNLLPAPPLEPEPTTTVVVTPADAVDG